MTFGVSNLPGANGAFPGAGLSDNGTLAAQNFLNALLGQNDAPKSGGEAFLADVKDAKNPEEKRALIDGFAEGFAAASEGGEKAEGGKKAGGGDKAEGGEKAGAAKGAEGAGEGGEKAGPGALMKGFQEIADKVAESDLPKDIKNKLLDGIAELMSKLKGEAGGKGEASGKGGKGEKAADGARTAKADEGEKADKAYGGEPKETPAESQPSAARADCSTQAESENTGAWTHEVKDGQATIRLGDKYTIKAGEKGAEWTVTNNETGKSSKISGDPHADINNDGKNDFDFKKDMSFQLDDGTKITVGTVGGGENGTTFSSKLTITNGDNAIQVSGINEGEGDGKLAVTQSTEGETVDDLTSDGSNTIYENGGAWQTREGNAVTQAYIDDAEKVAA